MNYSKLCFYIIYRCGLTDNAVMLSKILGVICEISMFWPGNRQKIIVISHMLDMHARVALTIN
jgi:hypothetical protein